MKTWEQFIGQRIVPRGGPAKVSGSYPYPSDIQLDGMLQARILKSSLPHARIKNIDVRKVEEMYGVACVLTHKDVPSGFIGPARDRRILDSVVRFVGDYVAAVAAVDEDIASDALNLINVDYEPLAHVFDPIDAMKPGAPMIYPPDNVLRGDPPDSTFTLNRGNVAKGFQEAFKVYSRNYHFHASHGMALEPRCSVATWADGRLTLYDTNQSPYHVKDALSKVLQLPAENVRVVCQATGGGYGSKARVQPYHFIASLLAMRTGKPVKLWFTREDETLAGHISPEVKIDLKIGVTRDGSLTAIHERSICNVGGWNQLGDKYARLQARTAATLYRKCPNVRSEAYAVYTNTPSAGPYRGYAERISGFALECLLDEIAVDLGFDPMDLRRKSWVTKGDDLAPLFPEEKVFSVGLEECVSKCVSYASTGVAGPPQDDVLPSVIRGTGMALGIKMLGPRLSPSSAGIELLKDGEFIVRIGTPDIGTEQQTSQAQIAADALGAHLDDVKVCYADTDDNVPDFGIFSDRSTAAIGRCVIEAALSLVAEAKGVAAEIMGEQIEDLEVSLGRIYSKTHPEKNISYAQMASELDRRGRKLSARFSTNSSFEGVHGFASALVQLKVDALTGDVKIERCVVAQDVGKAINPMLIEGQIDGCVAQAIGSAIYEKLVFEPGKVQAFHETGRVLNPGYLDYQVPTILEMPEIVPIIIETFEPLGPFGAKGAGQASMGAIFPAVINALSDAVGTRFYEIPVTRGMVLDALRRSGKGILR